jgi:hypothetical protein
MRGHPMRRGMRRVGGWRVMSLLPSLMTGLLVGATTSMKYWWKGSSCRVVESGMERGDPKLSYSTALWYPPWIVVKDGERPYPTPSSYPALAVELALTLVQLDQEVQRLRAQEDMPRVPLV